MKIPISQQVYLLKGKSPFPYCNCLLIEDKTRAVIDTGMAPAVMRETVPESVGLVLNSHAHIDHMHGNWAFERADIGFHSAMADQAQTKEGFGKDYILAIWSHLMSTPLNLEYQLDRPQDAMIFKDSVLVNFPASRVDFTFEHGEEFDLGRLKLKALHTPGHCWGHCCFYCEQEGILFSADIDFNEGGPWYFNASADIDEFIASINSIAAIDPRVTIPGHGRVIKGPIGPAAGAYLEHINRREDKILQLLDQPRTLDELTGRQVIFSQYIRPTLYFWERVMIFKHLNRLIRLGEVTQEDQRYFRTGG